MTRNHPLMLRDLSGVKAAKPRLKPAKEELPELSREYLEIRNAQMRTKNLTAEMQLAEHRGELIEKRLVEAQAAYILVAFRQRMLNLGQTWARRFVGLPDARAAKRLIDEMARSTLTELAQFPERMTDPNWISKIDADLRPAEGVNGNLGGIQQELRAEAWHKQHNAKRRAKRKGS